MAYKLFKSPQVDIDLENAYEYYFNLDSTEVLVNFDNAIEDCYQALELNPFYQVRYKNVRALPVKRFPYIILFTVDEANLRVDILSIFQTKQHPDKYPK